MKITISGDCHMYIYLKDKDKHEYTGSLSDIKCCLLYDLNENFIGIRILSKRSDTGECLELPKMGEIEFPLHSAVVSQDDEGILIMFNQEAVIHKEVEDECILDLSIDGIAGVEPMPYTNIGGKEVIKRFVIKDVDDVILPSW
ncbi:hypothetical protein [Paenibacillus sp. MMO-58]|uniref:hypothetical protein n=1 Tax=Paenibacillus sp. MMO-58 TaxID=3081290 RepID=UPI00301AE179